MLQAIEAAGTAPCPGLFWPVDPPDAPKDAWGNLEIGAVESGYAFTGREWDPEIGLYYYRARYYDPKAGRFIGEDPIGFAGGSNFYAYVNGNPTGYVDPLGLEAGNLNVLVPGPNGETAGKGTGPGGDQSWTGTLVLGGLGLAIGVPAVVAAVDLAPALLVAATIQAANPSTQQAVIEILESAAGGPPTCGQPGSRGILEVPGGSAEAKLLFEKLVGENAVREVRRGVFVAEGKYGGNIMYRAASKSGPPTVDVNGVFQDFRKVKFIGN